MRLRTLFGLIALAPALAGAPAGSHAQSALEGTYALVADSSADVGEAVREGTAGANFFVRKFGRRVLERTLKPVDTLRIAFVDDGVVITATERDAIRTPLDGSTTELRNAAGEMESVGTEWDGSSLVRVFRAAKGTREMRYALEPDGDTLRVSVEVQASVLAAPIRYTLMYLRVGERRARD
ncbi:MAG TPA: hypothetical protein VFZ69_07555 [Longimicrobiales bacterium]